MEDSGARRGLMKGKWWEMFGDPQLNSLEEMVDIGNRNGASRRNFMTHVVAANPRATSDHWIEPVHHAKRQRRRGWPEARSGTSQSFSLPFSASWEPDFWGRVRLSVEDATANAQGERRAARMRG